MQTLGDCCALVRKEFPSIDDVLFGYIESILETSGDDFENDEDIFEAIGGVLQEVDQSKTEDSIKIICNKIMCLIHGNDAGKQNHAGGGDSLQNGVKKLTLDAPVHLGSLVENQSSNQEFAN